MRSLNVLGAADGIAVASGDVLSGVETAKSGVVCEDWRS